MAQPTTPSPLRAFALGISELRPVRRRFKPGIRDTLRFHRGADLDEAALLFQRRESLWDEFTVEAVQDNVHTLSSRPFQDLLGEVQASGVHHVLDSLRAEEIPLRRAGCGKYLRADALRPAHGRLADAACRRVDQDAIARLELRQVVQSVVGGHKHERAA